MEEVGVRVPVEAEIFHMEYILTYTFKEIHFQKSDITPPTLNIYKNTCNFIFKRKKKQGFLSFCFLVSFYIIESRHQISLSSIFVYRNKDINGNKWI